LDFNKHFCFRSWYQTQFIAIMGKTLSELFFSIAH